MEWFKRNWVWLLMNCLAILPLVSVFALFNLDLSGNGPFITIDMPSRMRETGDAMAMDRSVLWFPIHSTGEWAIRWLVVSLTITPLTILFGWKQKTRYRKLFGLFSFGYAALHLIFFIADQGLPAIFNEVNFVLGLGATLVMTALAITSNKLAIRTLKKGWKSLHKLVYPAAVFAVLHVALMDKGWLPYAVIILIGFALRISVVKRTITNLRKRPQAIAA